MNQTYIGTGVAFEVFNILQKEYGFHYVLQPPKVNTFEGEGGAKQMLLDGVSFYSCLVFTFHKCI